jgi:hypothetical protein
MLPPLRRKLERLLTITEKALTAWVVIIVAVATAMKTTATILRNLVFITNY